MTDNKEASVFNNPDLLTLFIARQLNPTDSAIEAKFQALLKKERATK